MKQRPKGLPKNCFYYDLAAIAADMEGAELCSEFAIKATTIFVGHLPSAREIAGQTYRTAVIDVSGQLVLCTQTTLALMTAYSKSNTVTCRLSRWMAWKLGLQNYPYFHGENSFVPDASPKRQQVSWVGSRWYSSMRAVAGGTLVTFSRDQQQPKVVVHVALSAPRLTTQLALVREFLSAFQRLVQQGFQEMLPASSCHLVLPVNLPALAPTDFPLVQAKQLRQFIFACHDDDLCQLVDGYEMSVREAQQVADYHVRAPRELKLQARTDEQ
ncbi:hypothetical protein [Loigolactobacillus binensis]|uniref:Uncharacterized protein n=1 Tax=Loigolactobacillus binensis TaxID=2559922 RepID=A0ABW3EAK3_9LACO|nr:hypothetical protein [Loigolactobacillus binensis]